MPGFQVTVMGVVVEGLPRITVHPGLVGVIDDGEGMGVLRGYPGGRGRWRSVAIGVPRGNAMCAFALSGQAIQVIRQPGPPSLRIGFVQNIVRGKRIASYVPPTNAPRTPPPVFRIERDGRGVGAGLLDCGTAAPPWFQGESESTPPKPPTPPARPPAPAVVHAFDNPRWSIPLSLSVPGRGDGVLAQVEMEDTFRLFAVVSDGRSYYPFAWIEWGTDITFTVNPGQQLRPGEVPAGSWTGRKVWADARWQTTTATRPIVTGLRANQVLVDELV